MWGAGFRALLSKQSYEVKPKPYAPNPRSPEPPGPETLPGRDRTTFLELNEVYTNMAGPYSWRYARLGVVSELVAPESAETPGRHTPALTPKPANPHLPKTPNEP